eukprot:9885837-Karenia_brevis.AAC.1
MDATGASNQGKQGTDLPTGNGNTAAAAAAEGSEVVNREGNMRAPDAEQPTPPGSNNMPQAGAGQQPG